MLRSITHEPLTVITKPARKGIKRPRPYKYKMHNVIVSLTTSDVRNSLGGRFKVQENPKMKITLSQKLAYPLLAYYKTVNFHLATWVIILSMLNRYAISLYFLIL